MKVHASFGIIKVFEQLIYLHEMKALWEICCEVCKQKLTKSRNFLFWPCGITWASNVRDNKCGSPHHQSWDRKKKFETVRILCFWWSPISQSISLDGSCQKNKRVKFNMIKISLIVDILPLAIFVLMMPIKNAYS